MSVRARQKHRIVWRDFVQVPTRRKHRRLPEGFDPAAACYPLSWLRFIDALFHLGEKSFEVRDAFEIQIHLALADAYEVIMRIGHSRHDRLAVQIDDASCATLKLFDVGVRADKDDPIAFYGDSFCSWLFLIYGVDVAIYKNNIGGFGRRKK